jgi:heterodisulfide reductase subunit A
MGKKMGKALVVGAGISGIRSALDLAETGYTVTLVDRESHMGGILSQLDNQFPSNHCGMCKMLPLVKRDQSTQSCLRKGLFHENIDILLNTEIVAIDGEPGKFSVSIREKPTWVDPARCIGCGVCETVCPVEIPDAFNEGLTTRKAIYLPVPHTIPNPYVIDLAACSHCGECETVCPTQAVQLSLEKRKDFRILVVDDELIVRDSLKAWLDEEDFFVEVAESGPMALEQLSKRSFDLMLTDIKMPGMDGVALLKQAKENFPDLCVLMMTAYATVETAVEAMKMGASDYLLKPFDPEQMITKIVQVYEAMEAGDIRQLDVGAIVFSGGTAFFEPDESKNIYGYQTNPHVITSLELERLLSGTGPTHGRLIRPHDGKTIEKIAWIQCVGSRDVQCNADYCSSVCCMVAIKEALLIKKESPSPVETAIFYMDMRTFGKSFQRYRDSAEQAHGVRFERARIHSIIADAVSGNPTVRFTQVDGRIRNETFDLVVLAVGQRPARGIKALSELIDVPLNPWGFIQTEPLSPVTTDRSGILAGGSFSGLKDISESVIYSSAASLEASRILHAAGGSLSDESFAEPTLMDVSREEPKMLVAVCTCGSHYAEHMDVDALQDQLEQDPCVDQVVFLQQCCTAAGWEELTRIIEAAGPNRILLGACHPYLYTRKLRALSQRIHLNPEMMDVVDIMSPIWAHTKNPTTRLSAVSDQLSRLKMGISRLKNMDPLPANTLPVSRRALVVGGGIAGMHAALAIADHGYPVDLVEQSDTLGGNLRWLHQTIEGVPLKPYLDEMVQAVDKHPHLHVHLQTQVTTAFGEVGDFYTTLESGDGTIETVQHGTAILATGGSEATTSAYGYGKSQAVMTQKELETALAQGDIDAQTLDSVVMIQCVESRQEPRNYCSRVCCPTSLKHALALKKANPQLAVYILYRDIMAPGFSESYFTAARRAGVVFIQYDPGNAPRVTVPTQADGPVTIALKEPILDRPVEIQADLLVLATGIVPQLPAALADAFAAETDQDGFFLEAESKWRPVDALKEGIFACGIALSPRSIPDTIATAGAAAQRALRILAHEKLSAGKIVASVRHSLCSLCERCIDTCPYHARGLDPEGKKIVVNPAMCQACGSCATTCPNSASIIRGFTDHQVLDMIDAAVGSAWPSRSFAEAVDPQP